MSSTAGKTRRRRCDRGATAAEYALLISLIAVIILGAVTLFGGNVKSLFEKSCSEVAATQGKTC